MKWSGRQNECQPYASLFGATHGVKVNPNDIARVGQLTVIDCIRH
jgi:hypothetical protein